MSLPEPTNLSTLSDMLGVRDHRRWNVKRGVFDLVRVGLITLGDPLEDPILIVDKNRVLV